MLVSGAPLGPEGPGLALFPAVIVLAFLFETMDPASGMLWAGAFPAGVVAPYAVRVLPSRIWRYVIPAYAIGIAGVSLAQLYGG